MGIDRFIRPFPIGIVVIFIQQILRSGIGKHSERMDLRNPGLNRVWTFVGFSKITPAQSLQLFDSHRSRRIRIDRGSARDTQSIHS